MNQHNPSKCSSHELKMLGDFWTLQIIQILSDGEIRFSRLESELPLINPTTLSNRLKRLESQKIIKRKEETLDKLSVVYCLTKNLSRVSSLRLIIFWDS